MFITKELLEGKHLPDAQVQWFTTTYPDGIWAGTLLRTEGCAVDAHWLYYMLVNARRKKLLNNSLEKALIKKNATDGIALTEFYVASGKAVRVAKQRLLRANKPVPPDRQLHYELLGTSFKHRHAALIENRRARQQALFTEYFLRSCDIPDSFGERVDKFMHRLYETIMGWALFKGKA